MSNTYIWSITELNCIPTVGSLTDYVVTSYWLCKGTDGVYTGQVYGSVTFTINPDKADYTPYDQLTEAEVLVWTEESLGVDGVDAVYRNIDMQVQAQSDPPVISPPLPWKS